MKVLSVVGARPQFIKAFTVTRELRKDHEEVLVHTGQHYDEVMSDVFFQELGLPEPDYNLGVGSTTHGQQTGEMLIGIEELLIEEDPDLLLLYGDTNSTLAGAIAGSKTDLEMAHIEAGLRSFRSSMPEEINRVLTDNVCEYLFAPSQRAVSNLEKENLTEGVYFTGDVMFDAILWAKSQAKENSNILDKLSLDEGEFILGTIHRPRNTDDSSRLETIIRTLSESLLPVVIPLHPRTKDRLHDFNLYDKAATELKLIDPVGYLDFVRLLDASERVITDSGGVQKEAFYLDTFCITLREETEWVETVEAGWNVLVGGDAKQLSRTINEPPEVTAEKPNPYGDGNAVEKILDVINRLP